MLGLATPGVEDGGEVKFDVGCFEFCGGDVVEGLGGAFEEEGVEGFGLMMAEGAELLGDGEGDHLSRRSLGVGGSGRGGACRGCCVRGGGRCFRPSW